jgi:hypothetical protein
MASHVQPTARPRSAGDSARADGSGPRASASPLGAAGAIAARVPPWVVALLGPAGLLGVGTVMLAWTWMAWPDVTIDFGTQLYLPWQIVAGKVLYRDLAYYNAALPQYFNAGVLAVLGVGLRSLVISNLAWMAALTACLYWLFRQATSRPVATAVCAVFLLVFAFAQYLLCGNYNYVCPYSHDLTHGLTLLAAATAALWRLHRRPVLAAAVAGACLGAIFAKAELFVVALASVTATLALVLWTARATRGRWIAAFGAMLATMTLAPLATWALLARAMPATAALGGALGSWSAMGQSGLRDLPFYRKVMGLDAPGANLASMLLWTLAYAAVLAPAVGVGLALRRAGRGRLAPAVAVGVLTAGTLLVLGKQAPWLMAGKPWPAMLAVMAAVQAVRLRKVAPQRRRAEAMWLSLVVLGAAMSGRMLLNCRVWHYGFIYAMPACLVVCAWWLDRLPRAVDGWGGYGQAVRISAVMVLTVGVWAHLNVTAGWLADKTVWVGSGADAFRSDQERGRAVWAALARMAREDAGQELLVLPEGVMLNYLSRRASPTPYVNFMPPEVILFGQERMVRALSSRPAGLVAIVPKGMGEYGYRGLRDYAPAVAGWLNSHYVPLDRPPGPRPARGEFTITLARRGAASFNGAPPQE